MDAIRTAADGTADAIRLLLRPDSALTSQEQLNVIQHLLTAYTQEALAEKAAS